MKGKQKEKTYRIGELAKKAGVTNRTVLYYEKLGLLRTDLRTTGGQRKYTDLNLVFLLEIVQLKQYGLSLEEISRVIKLKLADSSQQEKRIELLSQYNELVEQEIATIQKHNEIIKQLKWNIAQLQNSEEAFRNCPGSLCEECEIKDSCKIYLILEKR